MTAIQRRPNDELEHDLLVTWLEEAHVGICVLDELGKVVMLNSAAGRKLHIDPVNMLQAPVASLLTHVKVDLDGLRWMAAPHQDGERQIMGAGDAPQRLLVKAHTIQRHGKTYKILSISDVTALWQANEATEALTRQWAALNAALSISDARAPDQPLTYVNPRFEEMTGYSAAECIGRNCRFLQGRDTLQPQVARMRSAIAAEEPVQVVLRNYKKDGTPYWVEVMISPVHDKAGVLTHLVAIQHPRNGPAA
jgi:PAS domain S-box-containing protein